MHSSSFATKLKLSPSDLSKVVILGSKGYCWISSDCVKTIKFLATSINEYYFHPTEKDWALAVSSDHYKNQNLRLSLDNGENWRLIIQNVVQVGWGYTGTEDCKVPKQRILLTFYPKQSASGNKGQTKNWFTGWTYKIDFVYSDDFFETTVAAVQKGNKFILTPRYLFVAILIDEETQEVGLVVTNSNEDRYLFNEVQINVKSMSSRSYIFLDTAENSVFIHINEFGTLSTFGNIYISNGLGGRYGLSLEYNLRNKENQCDFESIQGIEGIFIANVIDKQYIDNNIDDIRREIIQLQDNINQEELKPFTTGQNWLWNTLSSHVQSKITYNKGGNWSKIYPPPKGYDGRALSCSHKENGTENENCSLNLHGVSSSFPLVYSVKSAVGLILANGNVGKYLSYEEERIYTYLSRDAGVTWSEILQGPHIYEIGDNGGIIVFAKFNEYVDHCLYTLDQGLTFEKLYFENKKKVKILNIITTPENKTQQFIIVGKTINEGVSIHLNFSNLNQRLCNDNTSLFSTETDFEPWIPSAVFNAFNPCLMGQKTQYIRRKASSHCTLGESYEQKFTSNSCMCKAEDYECDIGYIRNGIKCIKETLDPNLEFDIFSPPNNCKDTYQVSKGYRKIPGNKCQGEGFSEFEPMIMYCPDNIFSISSAVLLMILFFGLFILFVLAFSKSALKFIKRLLGYQRQDINKKTDLTS